MPITKFRRIFLIILVFISLFFIYGLTRQISGALEAGKRLDKAAEELSQLQDENRRLQGKLEDVQRIDFVEGQIRDKLNMSKPDETIVVIPKSALDEILISDNKQKEPVLSNWQRWLNLFI